MSGTGLVIGAIGTAYTLRFGEFYADAFAAELLGKAVVSAELAKFARREKFIRYGVGFRITHPSFYERAQMFTEARISAWSLAVGSAIVVCQLAFYLTLMPDALVPAMGSLLVPLIFGGLGIAVAVAGGGAIVLLASIHSDSTVNPGPRRPESTDVSRVGSHPTPGTVQDARCRRASPHPVSPDALEIQRSAFRPGTTGDAGDL
jgi:hypothetical protein